jgi:hypothetical protein
MMFAGSIPKHRGPYTRNLSRTHHDSSTANVRFPMDCSHLREIVSIASRSYTLPKSRWPPNSGLFPVDKLADSRRCIASFAVENRQQMLVPAS